MNIVQDSEENSSVVNEQSIAVAIEDETDDRPYFSQLPTQSPNRYQNQLSRYDRNAGTGYNNRLERQERQERHNNSFYDKRGYSNYNNYNSGYNHNYHRYNRVIYCANCGEAGHVVLHCSNPITSFGIMCFKIVRGPEDEKGDLNEELQSLVQTSSCSTEKQYPLVKFLMIQRKQTMGYIDVLRGRYHFEVMKKTNTTREDTLQVCVNEMTYEEKENICTRSFDDLWDEVWLNKNSKVYKNEKLGAKMHFYENLEFLKRLIKESITTWETPEMGFPKGRKSTKEQNLDCAKREFTEETGFNKEDYTLVSPLKTFKETFVATNNVKYTHVYYLAEINKNVPPPLVDLENEVQAGEVKNVGWFTVEEAFELIRDYDIHKKKVLLDVYKHLITHNYI